MSLPKDPFIMLSFVNTMLRDNYSSLDKLCEDKDFEKQVITDTLSEIGYTYNEVKNTFE
ncbi:MAG: DUF4250 domain-containing protein [Clostridia bacterium]|nr:DUF4250 domain-containing protein [Clostridia bacterium]